MKRLLIIFKSGFQSINVEGEKTRSCKESYERQLKYLTWPWFADHRFKFGARSALKFPDICRVILGDGLK